MRTVRFGQVLARDRVGGLKGFGTLVSIISISASLLSPNMPSALSALPASVLPTLVPPCICVYSSAATTRE